MKKKKEEEEEEEEEEERRVLARAPSIESEINDHRKKCISANPASRTSVRRLAFSRSLAPLSPPSRPTPSLSPPPHPRRALLPPPSRCIHERGPRGESVQVRPGVSLADSNVFLESQPAKISRENPFRAVYVPPSRRPRGHPRRGRAHTRTSHGASSLPPRTS